MWLLPTSGDSGGVVVYDPQLRRLTTFHLDEAGRQVVDTMLYLRMSPQPRRVTAFGHRYLGWLSEPGPRWMVFGGEDSTVKLIDGPLIGASDIPFRERMHASSALVVCVRPDARRFAVLYVSAGRIEMHDSNAAFIRLAAVPDSSNGDFEQQPGGGWKWSRHRYYYSDCAATPQYLFALFSGNEEGPAAEVTFAGRDMEVFDWDGNLKGRFKLSIPIVRFALDPTGEALYGSATDGVTIYRFDVPVEFQGTGR
jgi:hypothetical protein